MFSRMEGIWGMEGMKRQSRMMRKEGIKFDVANSCEEG